MARWINKEVFIMDVFMECSECSESVKAKERDNGFSIDRTFPKYCPNCGAKMENPDGEDGDGDG